MKQDRLQIGQENLPVLHVDTVVVGSGCAGYNAADTLAALGEKDLVLLTEGITMGTSRNAGSDKQTYYKLSLSGGQEDSVLALAKTLYTGGGMEGVHALCEAAGSVQSFMKLVQLGVPFPTNKYGEYVGYQTDHDPLQRASSCGPLTSRIMTEALEASVKRRKIPILDHLQVVRLLTTEEGICGLLCINTRQLNQSQMGLLIVRCRHVVLATGGPAIAYDQSVYPHSQTGMTGTALESGAAGNNLQEWQYGIASTKFRWNVSGTYQQVLPRYVSLDQHGQWYEFLPNNFSDSMAALNAVFLKGYQWPFDVRKITGSSRIDLLVYEQIFEKGRRVFLDYRLNPKGLEQGLSGLCDEALEYLRKSGAEGATPVQRLKQMNPAAFQLYCDHGIDLSLEPLEISVCAQHCNGGLRVDENWQTTVPGLYAAGEVAGTLGVYRPGGSALNSTQVGARRAAEHIVWHSQRKMTEDITFFNVAKKEAKTLLDHLRSVPVGEDSLLPMRAAFQKKMSACAAHLRDLDKMERLRHEIGRTLEHFWEEARIRSRQEIPQLLKTRDMLIVQSAMLSAMETCLTKTGSHGSGLVLSGKGTLSEGGASKMRWLPEQHGWERLRVETIVQNGVASSRLCQVEPIPVADRWFERVWKEYTRHVQNRKEATEE